MEKKINKLFFILSAINLIPVLILGGGLTLDSLALAVALVLLMVNHLILVKIVESLTASARGGAPQGAGRVLALMGLKLLMLFFIVLMIYFYNKELVIKLFMVIFFQLIIQVLSIKNNYQNS